MEIRIYVEGGGDSAHTKQFLREGFSTFLGELVARARERRIRWTIIMCGPRGDAIEAFRIAQRQHPASYNIVLIDSESAVAGRPWQHLQVRGEWRYDHPPDKQCHFMAQAMEAWFIADPEALAQFYRRNFRENALPRVADVELIAKSDLLTALHNATRETQKRDYDKAKHAHKLLALLDPAKVRHQAPHCERLFTSVAAEMDASVR